MTLNPASYRRAAYPPLPARSDPRLFMIHWNNSKVRAGRRVDKDTWHEAHGVRWPNGRVSLDFGPAYDMMSDLESAFRDMGEYRIDWQDAGEQQEAAQ